MSLSIKMPTLADCPDYQCHCAIQHGPGAELEYCFAKWRAAAFKREAAWAEQAEQRAHRAAYWLSLIGQYAMGYDGIFAYEGEVTEYDAERDRYELVNGKEVYWIDGKTLECIPDPRDHAVGSNLVNKTDYDDEAAEIQRRADAVHEIVGKSAFGGDEDGMMRFGEVVSYDPDTDMYRLSGSRGDHYVSGDTLELCR